MDADAVDWTSLAAPATAAPEQPEGLRERKKRLMRAQLSATATQMFLDRGFDAVRVSEVAAACGVSEKTVFNYFPTKESLLLDRWDATMASLPTALAQPGVSPVEAALRVLESEAAGMTAWLESQDDPVEASAMIRRFGDLSRASPSLRAHQRDMMDRLIATAAEVLAQRQGVSPDDPEPQIVAAALLGLWDVQSRGLSLYLDGASTPRQLEESVIAYVRRAAHVLESGFSSMPVAGGDPNADPGALATARPGGPDGPDVPGSAGPRAC